MDLLTDNYMIKKFAIHDGPGIRTTVFLRGCPLDCWWCHNPEYRQPAAEGNGQTDIPRMVHDILEEAGKDMVFYEQSGGGVTISGGEPLAQMDLLEPLLHSLKGLGIHTALDTCGYAGYQHIERILPMVDLFLFDLKIYDDEEHRRYTGVSNSLIHENLARLAREAAGLRIRIPLIPGITDTERNLTELGEFLAGLDRAREVDLLPYNPLGIGKYHRLGEHARLAGLETQSSEELAGMRQRLESIGLAVSIGGGR